MPMPKPVCRTNLYNKILQLEICRTFSGRGMGMNITAHIGVTYKRELYHFPIHKNSSKLGI